MKNNIVISRYSEDLNWLESINKDKYKIFVYNKGNKIDGLKTYDIPNIGRESQTYLHHIIENYDNLSKYTVFLQGNPFEHDGNLKNFDYDNLVNFLNEKDFENDIYSIGSIHSDLGYLNEKKTIQQKMNIDSEINFFSVGAQFVIHKKNILNKPLKFWKTLHDWSLPNNGEYCHVTLPYILERLWLNIFKTDLK